MSTRSQKVAAQGPRIIVCFGPGGCGTTTLLETLQEASQTPMRILKYIGKDSIRMAEEAQDHVEIVFLDVDGGIFNPEDVQDLVDSNLTGLHMVRVHSDEEEILDRCRDRPDYITHEDITQWHKDILATEDLIRLHTLPYFMVENSDLATGVKFLALRSGISR